MKEDVRQAFLTAIALTIPPHPGGPADRFKGFVVDPDEGGLLWVIVPEQLPSCLAREAVPSSLPYLVGELDPGLTVVVRADAIAGDA